MADQLLFRGGNTVSIAGSTVSNREIVVDTETNQIVLGSQKDRTVMQDGTSEEVQIRGSVAMLKLNSTGSTNPVSIYQDGLEAFIKNGASAGNITFNTFGGGYLKYISGSTERVRIDSNGNVYIGGTIDSDPNISLNQGGGATFGGIIISESYFKSDRVSNGFAFQGTLNSVQTSLIKADGSSIFSGSLQVAGNPSNGGAAGARLTNSGNVQACHANGGSNVWAGFVQGTSSATSQISANGAATFNGFVQSGGNPANGGGQGVRLNANGNLTAARTLNDDRVWAGYKVGTTAPTSFITAAGRANFSNTVTATNITAFKTQLATDAAAATTLADLKTAITDALALL